MAKRNNYYLVTAYKSQEAEVFTLSYDESKELADGEAKLHHLREAIKSLGYVAALNADDLKVCQTEARFIKVSSLGVFPLEKGEWTSLEDCWFSEDSDLSFIVSWNGGYQAAFRVDTDSKPVEPGEFEDGQVIPDLYFQWDQLRSVYHPREIHSISGSRCEINPSSEARKIIEELVLSSLA